MDSSVLIAICLRRISIYTSVANTEPSKLGFDYLSTLCDRFCDGSIGNSDFFVGEDISQSAYLYSLTYPVVWQMRVWMAVMVKERDPDTSYSPDAMEGGHGVVNIERTTPE